MTFQVPVWKDCVRDVTATTGTGTVTVAGTPPTGYVTFSTRYNPNEALAYRIVHQSSNEWEVGIGLYLGAGQISRVAGNVLDGSSGPGTLVNFSAGTKDIYVGTPAYAFQGGSFRVQLTANTSFFVDGANGTDDDTHGLSAVAGAWKTLQFASDFLGRYYDLNGFRATVNIADWVTTYAGVSLNGHYSANNGGASGIAMIYFKGNAVTPSNVKIGNCTLPAGFSFGSFVLNAPSVGLVYYYINGVRMVPTAGACLDFDPIVGGSECTAFMGDPDTFTGSLELAGGSASGFVLVGNIHDNSSAVLVDGVALNALAPHAKALMAAVNKQHALYNNIGTWTFTGTPDFTRAIVWAQEDSYIEISETFSGAATGVRFLAERDAVIYTNGGRTYLPGNAIGIVRQGGHYVDGTSGYPGKDTANCGVDNRGSELNFNTTTTFTVTLNDTDGEFLQDSAATTGTITMCANPIDNQVVAFRTKNAITAITFTPNAGQSVVGVPASLTAGQVVTARYRATNTTWYF